MRLPSNQQVEGFETSQTLGIGDTNKAHSWRGSDSVDNKTNKSAFIREVTSK